MDVNSVIGKITPPEPVRNIPGNTGEGQLSFVLSNLISIIISFGIIAFIFSLIIGAVQWITSGGDKEKAANARGRITFAIVGVSLLALSFVIIRIIEQIFGIQIFSLLPPPPTCTPSRC